MPGPRPSRRGVWGSILLLRADARARSAEKRGENLEAVDIAGAYIARWRGNAGLYATLTAASWALSRWKDCIRYGRLTLRLDPGRSKTAIFMISAYRSANELARGIAFGEAWLSRFPSASSVYRHLAILYDDADRLAEALAVTRRGLEVDPGDLRLAAVAAHFMARHEGAERALKFAEPYMGRFSRDEYCGNTLAEGLNTCGAHAEAERIFESVMKRSRRDAKVFANLLGARMKLGKHAAVLEAVQRWKKKGNPMTAAIANEAGRACVELGQGDEALRWMRRAMDLDPDSPKYADNLAITLGRLDRHAECVDACRDRLESPGGPDRRRLLTAMGVAYSFLGKHGEAHAAYQQAFREFPGNDEVLVNAIVGFTWLNRYEEAAALGLRFRESRGPAMPVRYWSELAWSLHEAGRLDEELSVVEEWHRRHPHDPEVTRCMNRALNGLKRPGDALAFSREWTEAHPDSAWGWRYLARQHQTCLEPDAALKAMAESCRLAPGDPGFASAHIEMFRDLSRSREGFDAGCAWVAAHPDRANAELLNRIGLAADDLEIWEEARSHYHQAHRAEPAHETWFGNYLRALIFLKRAKEAVELGRAWIAENPWSNYVAAKQAWALRSAELRAEESEILQKAVDAEPSDNELSQTLLSSLVAQGRTEEAERFVRRCMEAGHASGRLCNDLANHLRDIGRLDDSEALYREAQTIAPDNGVVAGNLASLLVHRRRVGEAVELCRVWLERRPDDGYVRKQLANALYDRNEYAAAEREFRAALALEPGSQYLFGQTMACLRLMGNYAGVIEESARWLGSNKPTAFLLVEIGISAHRLSRTDEALKNYEAALELDPACKAAAERKMALLGESGRLDLALDFAEKWTTAHPAATDSDFHNDMGILMDRAGRTAKAEACFLKAVELDPANPTLAGNAVEILGRRRRIEESIQLGQRLLANSPPNAYLMRRLAEVYAINHEHRSALDLLASADALEPKDPDVAHAFLRIALESGELERGIEFGRAWLARPGNERQAGVKVHLSRLCFRADYDDEALEALEAATKIEPDQVSHIRLRFAYRNALRDHTHIVKEYESIRPEWRDDAHLLRYASRAYLELGLADEALSLAVRNSEVNPADDDVCAWLAELHIRCNRVESARQCLESWVRIHGEQPATLKVRARMAFQEQDYPLTLSDSEKVLGHDAADEDSFALLIRAMRALGRGAEARTRINHWIEHQRASERITELLDESDDRSGL